MFLIIAIIKELYQLLNVQGLKFKAAFKVLNM